jgi:hypothetical protein
MLTLPTGHEVVSVLRDHDQTTLAQVTATAVRVWPGYCWDGVTLGPDHARLLEASIPHDIICQMIRAGQLSPANQPVADALFRAVAIECGVSRRRAWIYWAMVRSFQRVSIGF